MHERRWLDFGSSLTWWYVFVESVISVEHRLRMNSERNYNPVNQAASKSRGVMHSNSPLFWSIAFLRVSGWWWCNWPDNYNRGGYISQTMNDTNISLLLAKR